jgi:hypothetical protein
MVFVGWGVKPHVQKAADQMQAIFHYKRIWGWPGNGETGDHPKGLALDFMVYGDAIKGQQTANYLVTNYDNLGLTYIIWNRQSYSKPRGTWKRYNGFNPHTDHVHASFAPKLGPSTDPTPDGPPTPDPSPEKESVDLSRIVDIFTDKRSWLRLGYFIFGFALIVAGVIRLRGVTGG